ncbi:uncharacterized protein VTP21DRAFT_6142 [Calcarisporiella thermophila]|uniref:uncharacterized protein n=1 Tax=Calcarisporiella thermophila TaxID=911321 RepID=UPI0037442C2C
MRDADTGILLMLSLRGLGQSPAAGKEARLLAVRSGLMRLAVICVWAPGGHVRGIGRGKKKMQITAFHPFFFCPIQCCNSARIQSPSDRISTA